MRFRHAQASVAPVSKDGAGPWFETPRTRLRDVVNPELAAPHHEAGKEPRVHQTDLNPLQSNS